MNSEDGIILKNEFRKMINLHTDDEDEDEA